MKLSKRTGMLLLAVGASAIATQGTASAAPMTSGEVAATENHLATQQVPFTVPLTPLGTAVSGGVPSSLVMPPVPGRQTGQLVPDKVVPALTTGQAGPELKTEMPLPALDQANELGKAVVELPAAPLKTAGPALTLGHVLENKPDGGLSFGDVSPQLITAPVQAVPGAKATLGGDDKRISLSDTLSDLAGTAEGAVGTAAAAADAD